MFEMFYNFKKISGICWSSIKVTSLLKILQCSNISLRMLYNVLHNLPPFHPKPLDPSPSTPPSLHHQATLLLLDLSRHVPGSRPLPLPGSFPPYYNVNSQWGQTYILFRMGISSNLLQTSWVPPLFFILLITFHHNIWFTLILFVSFYQYRLSGPCLCQNPFCRNMQHMNFLSK